MALNQDPELIKRAKAGDSAAFEALVNGCYDNMFRMAFKWCGNKTMAEDITQEACIKLARGIGSYRFDAAFSSWLYRLVINTAKDWMKSQARHTASEIDPEFSKMESSAETHLHVRDVMLAIQKLPEGEKDALLLVASEGLSHKEAADILGIRESTVSWRVHEARKKLKTRFEKEVA